MKLVALHKGQIVVILTMSRFTAANVQQVIATSCGYEPSEVTPRFDGTMLTYVIDDHTVSVLVTPCLAVIVGRRTGRSLSTTELAAIPTTLARCAYLN